MTFLLNLENHVRIVGILLLLLAFLNLFVPAHFAWPAELQRLSLFTRQVFIVHCAFIILVLVMMGLLSLCYTRLLTEPSPLATVILFGLATFWIVRLGTQLFFYSPKLWRGNRFNTTMHVLFSCVWTYFSAVFGIAWLHSMR